ncbi:hypothetical protein BH11PAT4_BH11PAT4_2620 [soil metagenome]
MPSSDEPVEKFYCFVLRGIGSNEGKIAFVRQPRMERSPLYFLPYVRSCGSLAEATVALSEKYHLPLVGEALPIGAVTYKYASAPQTLGAASNADLRTDLEVYGVGTWTDQSPSPFEYFSLADVPELPAGDDVWVQLALKQASPFDVTLPVTFHPLVCPTARREEYGSGRKPGTS